ncbi:MAG: hypothetical protein RBS24_00115 [Bacilli bacterium]|nr:hypothetical protein [Bacilli bacterium]
MYELEKVIVDAINSALNFLKAFFTKVAIYLLVIVVALVFLTIIILIIKSFFTREKYIERGNRAERQELKQKKNP